MGINLIKSPGEERRGELNLSPPSFLFKKLRKNAWDWVRNVKARFLYRYNPRRIFHELYNEYDKQRNSRTCPKLPNSPPSRIFFVPLTTKWKWKKSTFSFWLFCCLFPFPRAKINIFNSSGTWFPDTTNVMTTFSTSKLCSVNILHIYAGI